MGKKMFSTSYFLNVSLRASALTNGDNTTSKKLYLNNVEIKPPVKNLNNYYVSPSGTNSLGDGSISNPWFSIGHAISTLSSIAGDIQASINISAGTYTDNLTINKSGIALIGASSNLPNLTTINGNQYII